MRSPGGGYAHINGMHVVDGACRLGGVARAGLDAPGVHVLWRMGRTNLSDAGRRGTSARGWSTTLRPAQRFLPNGNVFLFDNGVL